MRSGLMSGLGRTVMAGFVFALLSTAAAQAEDAPTVSTSTSTSEAPADAASSTPPAASLPADAAAPVPSTVPGTSAAAPDSATPPAATETANATLPSNLSPLGMFLQADWVVKAVMIGLLLASVATWTVWLAKTIEIHNARKRARTVLTHLATSRTLAEATGRIDGKDAAAALVQAAAHEVDLSEDLPGEGLKERIVSRTDRIEAAAARAIGRGTGILASIGSTAPFIGLFGTVWGIMNSFIGISKSQTTNLAVVAPGIAEALLATATGLVAAIPAVLIYNAFTRSIGGYKGALADISAEVSRLASRDYDRRAASRFTNKSKAAE
ncbi:MAG: tonB-system energizer ExbB [Parvibaculaceae bacterium]|nr:tonB-system energizer ExbB [Parvibaculaceae bacterium]